jgi:sugar lactone lactonase YvrE
MVHRAVVRRTAVVGVTAVIALLVLAMFSSARAGASCDLACRGEAPFSGLAHTPSWAKGRHIYFMPTPQGLGASRRAARAASREEPTSSLGEGEPGGELIYHEGLPVQHSIQLHLIFWGKNFTSGTGSSARSMLLSLFNNLSGSAYQGILTQYFDTTGRISSTLTTSSFIDERASAPTQVSLKSVESEIGYAIEQNGWERGPDSQFMVLTAPGASYEIGSGFCGFHHYLEVEKTPEVYDFLPFPGDSPFEGCVGYGHEKNPVSALSVAASHEYAEAATNPHVNGPWRALDTFEIADICVESEGSLKSTEIFELPSGAWVQNLFDDHLNTCDHADLNPPHVYGATVFPEQIRTIEAGLRAEVNPEGLETKYHFQYGTTNSYGLQTAEVSAGSSQKNQTVLQMATGLSANTLYHYRVVVTNASGTNYGDDEIVRTGTATPPTVVTTSPTGVSATGATLNGTVDGHSWTPTYHFEYGTSTAYGTNVPIPDKSISGSGVVPVANTVTGLRAETTYHYRLVAQSNGGTVRGEDKTLTTPPREFAFGSTFGSLGSGSGQFNRPVGAAVDQFNNVWISDAENNRVEHFTRSGETMVFGFGTKGSGNGQLIRPLGLAFDPGHNLWVADSGNHRVQEFNLQGEYLGQFGSEGSGAGQFQEPAGIAVTPVGNIWVSDAAGNRLEEFTGKGAFIREVHGIGFGGKGNAEFLHPQALAADAAGNVWVADTGNHRVQEFSESGAFIAKFGSEGSGGGQFKEPAGIVVNPAGKLLVVDKGNARVQVLSTAGEFLGQFGSKGSAPGQFSEPQGIALGNGGAAFVVDSGNNRVERWNQQGSPEVVTFGGVSYSFEKPGEVTISGGVYPRGLATTYQLEYGLTTAYGTRVPVPAGSVGEGFERVTESQTLTGLPQQTQYHFRIVATNSEGTTLGNDVLFETPNWKPLVTTGSASGVTATGATLNGTVNPGGTSTEYHFEYGKTTSYGTFVTGGKVGSGFEAVAESKAVTGLQAGTTYHYRIVANNTRGDTSYGNDQTFTTAHAFERTFGVEGERPTGIAVDSKGNVWVVDTKSSKVVKFSATGEFLTSFGKAGSGPGQFVEPQGVAVSSTAIWVTDAGNHRVEKFGLGGEYMSQFGSEGTKEGQFLEPAGIAVAPSGNLWVSDRKGNRVIEFTSLGAYVREQHGKEPGGNGNGEFLRPYGVAIDSKENVWVADTGNNRLQKLSPTAEYLSKFGEAGSKEGQLSAPAALVIAGSGELLVADAGNSRVEVFTASGGFVSRFGEEGTLKTAFMQPQGIAMASGGSIYVADTGNNRVAVWR